MDYSEDKATYVQQTFDAIANRYDLMNRIMSMGMDQRWRQLTVKQVGAEPGMHILDVCCGTGQISKALSKAVGTEGTVTGLDFCRNMLKVAEHSLQTENIRNINFVQGNALELPFPDQSFDGVTVGWGLRNLPDLRQGIREMVRVVKAEGKIVSLDMAKPSLPVFKEVYWLYFKKIVPLMGKIWTNKAAAYQYFYESAQKFPNQTKLSEIFAECGLVDTGYKNLAGGVVAIVYGMKPDI